MESFLLKKLEELAEESTTSDSSYSECQTSSEEEDFLWENFEQTKKKKIRHNETIQTKFKHNETSETKDKQNETSKTNDKQNETSENEVKQNQTSETNIVPPKTDDGFESNFRISRTSLEKLINDIRTDIKVIGRPRVPLKDALLATIWMLATQESLRSVGNRFGFSKGHIHRIFVETCKLMTANIHKYIIWPTGQEATSNIDRFNSLSGEGSLQGVFGCVDATHIHIPGPITDNSYYNRKGFHSVILQGICNAKMEFINVSTGWPGSYSDAMVWTNSEVYNQLKDDVTSFLPAGTFLLGDTAYPLDKFLMVPFMDNGHLTGKQHIFNEKLSSTRIIIEQAFGRLKGQFKKLQYVNVLNLDYVKYIVLSACILYNISLKDGVIHVDEDPENEEPDSAMDDSSVFDNHEAIALRNEIVESII